MPIQPSLRTPSFLPEGAASSDVSNLPNPPDTDAVSAQPQVQPGQEPQAAQPQPVPDKHSAFGRLARSLLTGTDVSYQYDDQGKLVETRTPQKPGQMFRHMLAGAMLGGAIGAQDREGGFAGGLTRGGAGVGQAEEQRQASLRAQAKDAYEMRLKGMQSGREDEKLGMEKQKLELEKREQDNKDKLGQAQTAMYNSEVLRNNTISQGATLEQHLKTKQFFSPEVETFKAMGLEPAQAGISEDEMHSVWEKRPDSGGLTWVVSDVKMGVGPDGNPTYQYVYNGYNVKDSVPVSEATLKLWKQSGLAKTHPEIFKYKPDTKIPANNFKAWNQQALANMNQTFEIDKSSVDIAAKHQQIEESKARAAKDIADAGKQNKELKKEKLFEDAMNDLSSNGYDIAKVKPEHRGVIGQYAGAMLRDLGPSYSASVKVGEQSGDYSEAHKIAQQMDDFRNLMHGTVTKTPEALDTSKLPKPATGGDTSLFGKEGQTAYIQYKAAYPPGTAAGTVLAAMAANGWTAPPEEPGVLSKAADAARGFLFPERSKRPGSR